MKTPSLDRQIADLQKQISRMQGRRVLTRDEDGRVELPGGIIIGDGPGEVPLVPGVPDGPTSAPTVETGAHGNRIFADLSWQEVPGAVSYVASVREDGGTFVARVETHGTSARFDWLEPNTTYIGWVVAIDTLGRSTEAGPSVTFQTGQDTTIPSPVTGLTVTGGVRAIHASWDASEDHDFDWFEVAFWELSGDTETSRIKATRTFWSDLEPNRQYRVRVRAIDTSTNVGPWSSWQSAVTVDNPAAHIEEGSIETIHLANQAVDETKIQVASLVGDLFADNAIDRDSILGAGTVVGDHIVSNSIQTGHVQAGAITGDLVDADTITARNMVLGSYDNLAQNPSFDGDLSPHHVNTDGGGQGWLTSTLARTSGGQSLRFMAGNASEIGEYVLNGPPSDKSSHPPCSEGDEFVFSCWVRRNLAASQTAQIRIIFYDSSGSAITPWAQTSVALTNQWAFHTVSAVAPAGAAWVTAWLFVPSAVTGTVYFDDAHLRERITADLLVDGAVTARTLAAEELITSSAQIGDAVITNAKIGNISAAKITTGTLDANRIGVGTLNADRLEANTAIVSDLTLAAGGRITASSATNNSSVEFSSDGLEVWSGSGERLVWFSTAANAAIFSGSVHAATITSTTMNGGTINSTELNSTEINGGVINGGRFVSRTSPARGVAIDGQFLGIGWVGPGSGQASGADMRLFQEADFSGTIQAAQLCLDADSIDAGPRRSRIRFDDRVTVGMESGSSSNPSQGISLATNGRGIFRYSDGPSLVAGRLGSAGPVIEFRGWAGQSVHGSIDITSSGTINVHSGSDYRLKTVRGPVPDALDRLQQMAPKQFCWKVLEGTDECVREDGFIAHEVQQVMPWLVAGEKDQVDEDGQPVTQGMDYGKTTPLLAAAILELAAKVDDLTDLIEVS